ncbi:cytochrome c oxidase subunit 4 [Dactylosporangium aurantiacum]|uniref:Cytochrome c oxidase polypeptide 4 n=1 Tax=Dactylosporangium aurantiacum TaxID=35754 RepID=A0A9Q9MG81_9ACTN|nr:cytochrome c oxidase subunit 4 [Dactylosporangium aurantiacum]MDG6105802.1 cytochrome c oxidase subunit 4 [Dactylosporangium aurantiacum]UWZ58013.1 cytochrome c oxidase subunit 4 [Dactylosporangium aurantiacum]
MRTETRVFTVIGGFLAVVAVVYAALTAGMTGGVERVGTVALGLSAVLCAMTAGFMWLVSRRIPPRPEDRTDAEITDGAGDVGFFSPSSYWPLGVGVSAATAALGIATSQYWLTGVGVVGLILTVAGLMFEYYTGSARGGEH